MRSTTTEATDQWFKYWWSRKFSKLAEKNCVQTCKENIQSHIRAESSRATPVKKRLMMKNPSHNKSNLQYYSRHTVLQNPLVFDLLKTTWNLWLFLRCRICKAAVTYVVAWTSSLFVKQARNKLSALLWTLVPFRAAFWLVVHQRRRLSKNGKLLSCFFCFVSFFSNH